MGQLLAVFSPLPGEAEHHLAGCISAMCFATGLKPYATRRLSTCAIATFPRLAGNDGSSAIFDAEAEGVLGTSVGTWACTDGTSPAVVAQTLMAGLHRPANMPHHLASIEGCFCFLIARCDGDPAQVITDPVGQLHVYQARIGEATLISTSALVLAQVVQAGWDQTAVREFLARGTVYEHRSLFSGVEKLAPGTVYGFERGVPTISRGYWSVRDCVDRDTGEQSAIEHFAHTINTGTASLLRRFERPAFDLTGGFDSRILLASGLNSIPGKRLNTVVVGQPGEADVAVAGDIARAFNLAHRRLDSSLENSLDWWQLAQSTIALTDGECSMLEYAAVLGVHQRLAEDYHLSINGSGGELIRGYWWELLFPNVGARGVFDSDRVSRARFATDAWAEALLDIEFDQSLVAHFSGVIQAANEPLTGCRNTACMDNVYLMLRMQRWQGRIASATNRVWPCASPLLFRSALEAALRAPIRLRRNGRMARHLLRYLNYELARLPMAGGYPALPINLATAPRFAPLAGEYAKRAAQRLLTKSGMIKRRSAQPASRKTAELLVLEEVTDHLDVFSMLTGELYDRMALNALLRTASSGGPVPLVHISRILTLESVARLLQRGRTQTLPSEEFNLQQAN